MAPSRLDALRIQRSILLRQLHLLETAIAAEAGMVSFKVMDDRLGVSLDAACLANGACRLSVNDLGNMPETHELLPGLN